MTDRCTEPQAGQGFGPHGGAKGWEPPSVTALGGREDGPVAVAERAAAEVPGEAVEPPAGYGWAAKTVRTTYCHEKERLKALSWLLCVITYCR